jgi:Tfp pilus assembly protein PilZ
MAELVLVYLSIGDKKGIICALAEVVWISPEEEEEDAPPIGLRFLNVLEEDQERINAVVQMLLKRLDKTAE